MIIELAKTKTYIPEWNGNRSRPDEERISVEYRFLTGGEARKFRYFEPVEYDIDTGKPVSRRRRWIDDRPGMVSALVTRITNFGIRTDGKTVNIDTGAKLYSNPVPLDFITEIEAEVSVNCDPEVETDPTE